MPLEVNRIGIRLAVGEESAAAADASEEGGCGGADLAPGQRDALVRQCVAAVLAELARRSER